MVRKISPLAKQSPVNMCIGMGNRFARMAGYHSLIKAHGIIAAITFLGIIPAAIFLMRFYGRGPRTALRFHIWLQIFALILATVVLALGFFAVGPARALTNPHHGIGVAIYILLWWQMLVGCCFNRWEKNRKRLHIPVTAMIHQWQGRAIALLGITQVALGLTLYGCDKYLFVLYTLWCFSLLLLYFVLEWLHERRVAQLGGGGGSYYSDEVIDERKDRRHTGIGKLAAAGAAGVGLAALFRRRSQSRPNVGAAPAGSATSGTYSYSYYTDEMSEKPGKQHSGWGKRILEIGAIGGGIAAARKVFGRRHDDEGSVASGPIRPPLGGNQSIMSDSMSRLEEGRPSAVNVSGAIPQGSPGFVRPTHPLANPPITPGRRDSGSSYDYYGSDMSGSPSKNRKTHGFRDALATGGMFFAARELFKNRRQRKEESRAEEIRQQRLEEERIARMNSAHKYTGDGVQPPRPYRNQGFGSQTVSDVTGSAVDGPTRMGQVFPAAGVGAAAASALADRDRIRPVGADPIITTPGPPSSMPTNYPPPPPIHQTDPTSSGSEMYTTGSGRTRHRHHNLRDEAAVGLAGAALGAAAADHHNRNRDRRASGNTRTDSRQTDMESPPVSLKMKVHNDGRHVTLRRLTEEEAAAQRGASRAERRANTPGRRRRTSSFSSSGTASALGAGGDGRRTASADRRFRRRDDEAEAAGALPPSSSPSAYPPPPAGRSNTHTPFAPPPIDPSTGHPYPVGPPPPIPTGSSTDHPAGSVTSPGTDTSAAGTDYLGNRRRRRAERAQARLAKERGGGGGQSVEFT